MDVDPDDRDGGDRGHRQDDGLAVRVDAARAEHAARSSEDGRAADGDDARDHDERFPFHGIHSLKR